MGIGGEYAAINSAIDELIPAKYRGRVDIAVNGTYWGGALIATLFIIFVINHLPVSYSWRVAFLVGPALGFVILFVRKNLPESPRWLLMHGREEEAEAAVAEIEQTTEHGGGVLGRGRRVQGHRDHPGRQHRLRRPRPHAVRPLPEAVHPRGLLDDHPVVPLQRHLLHLRAGAHQDLRRPGDRHRLLLHLLRPGEPHRSAHHRAPLRHHRPTEDDHRDVPPVRGPARRQRLPVQCRAPERGDPDGVLVRDLLLRLCRRLRGLPDRERDLPGRGPGQGHRRLLRHCPDLRRLRPVALRGADRQWAGPLPALHRLPHRRRRDDLRRRSSRPSSASMPNRSRSRTLPSRSRPRARRRTSRR